VYSEVPKLANSGSKRETARDASESIRLHTKLSTTTETIKGYTSKYCAVFYLSIVNSLNMDLVWQRDFKQSTSGISGETEFFDITN
jgi:hypothetical protein